MVAEHDPDAAAHRWLVIAEEAFLPPDSGGRVESLNLVRAVRRAGIDLHVLVPGLGLDEVEHHRRALPGVHLDGFPRRTGWRAQLSVQPYIFASRPLPEGLVGRLLTGHQARPYTAVLAASFRVAHLGVLIAEALRVPLVVRPLNVESAYFRQLARSIGAPRNAPYLVEAWRLRRAEAGLHRGDRVALFADIAEEDATARRRLTDLPVIHLPPFLPETDVGASRPARGDGPGTVLFLGSLDNANNQGGIRWFAEECWPLLRTACPGTELHVVGRRAPRDLQRRLRAAGARLTIDAPDVAPHLAAADVFVNPVRSGAGVNIKMVEAMAAGLPVVSTVVGARGLHWREGTHLLIADDPAGFATAAASLLRDVERRVALAEAGRRFVREELDGVAQVRRLVGLLSGPAVPR